MSREAEEALERIVNEEIKKDSQFMDKVKYHNYLTEKYIWNQDCSHQFAYRGEAECEELCEHISTVAKLMVEKYPDMADEENN